MIVAQYRCGCNLNENDEPKCMGYCSASPEIPQQCLPQQQALPQNSYRQKFPKQLRRIADKYKYEDAAQCCPPEPDGEDEEPTRKIESEIAQKGMPYKELEAIINENRLVLRMMTEPPPVTYDPPCDCVAEEHTKQSEEFFEDLKPKKGGPRTVVVYPDVKSSGEGESKKHKYDRRDTVKVQPPATHHDFEQNPNIFILRIRKQSGNNDKKNNIDLEFRAPRPWSEKLKSEAHAEHHAIKARAKEVRKLLRAERKKRKRSKY